MSHIPKWYLSIEDIRGIWVFVITRGARQLASVEGTGTADDLDTCIDMAKECYWDCRKFRGEMPKRNPDE